VRLWGNQSIAFQDPPDGCHRRQLVDPADEVVRDGLGAGIVTVGDQFLAQLKDLCLDWVRCLV